MACAGCGFDASPDFAFCPRCGRKLPSPCPACGTPCEPDFAFCPRCGAARSGAATARTEAPAAGAREPAAKTKDPAVREADRRQVTVLFADLTGFTSLAERLDPEEVRAFQNALFETLARSIERYDGFVAPHAAQGAGCRRPQRGQKAKSGDVGRPQPAHAIVLDSLNRMLLDPHCSLGLRSTPDRSTTTPDWEAI